MFAGALAAGCLAQRGSGSMTIVTPGAGQNILYGDVRVDESKAGDNKPMTFTIVLSMAGGTVIGRQTVGNGQRYRFNDLADGDYDVAVELENRPITRERVRLYSQPSAGKTDMRHDIELEFRSTGVTGKGKATAISADDVYKRIDANQKLFDSAEKATNEKKYDQSITMLHQLVENDPKDFQAWTELGTAYLLKNAYDDSEKSYLAAINARPQFFLANLNLGRLYLDQKKFDKAVEFLAAAVKIKPDSADANQLLGEAYLQIKKGSAAVAYLNEAIRLDPLGKAEVHLRLALLYNAAGMKDKAAAEYESFLKKRPDSKDRKKLEDYIKENKKP
jgi:tetratricopeptide (TPR) repeat protein